jgi:hypothetical protein
VDSYPLSHATCLNTGILDREKPMLVYSFLILS